MILILVGIAVGIIGFLFFKRVVKDESGKLYVGRCFVSALSLFCTMMLIVAGFAGVRINEGQYQLKNTSCVTVQKQDDSIYEVFDEEANVLYYFEESQVEVLKDGKRGMYGNKIIYDCKILEGDYDQSYIEFYEVDYKMNWWSFELIDRPEYILYVPKDGAQ